MTVCIVKGVACSGPHLQCLVQSHCSHHQLYTSCPATNRKRQLVEHLAAKEADIYFVLLELVETKTGLKLL